MAATSDDEELTQLRLGSLVVFPEVDEVEIMAGKLYTMKSENILMRFTRSQALGALRELAVAKAKLKELRGLFNNFSYRRQILHDGEESQKFSERIIVLLLTVDAIEGADIMVRSARRSMIDDELEAMLEVVDPQPPGMLGSIYEEAGVRSARVWNSERNRSRCGRGCVHMLDQEERNGGTFEVCL